MQAMAGTIFAFTDLDESFRFFANDPDDYVQSYWGRGVLYEREELSFLAHTLPSGLVVLDIGSNLGNHAVFFAKALKAKRVVCFEALSSCANLLSINASLNDVSHILDLSYLKIGISNRPGLSLSSTPQGNLGATRLDFSSTQLGAGIPTLPIDALHLAEKIDFIKIDIEGAELRALEGAKCLIDRWRPPMLIEVDNVNLAAFHAWLDRNSYGISQRYKRYASNENFFIEPLGLQVAA
jgi:FkbM family methyltransferase